jgi:hypothetical protein
MPDSNDADPFQVEAIASVQAGLIAHLKANPVDVVVQIAALRACADLLQQAVTTTVLAQQIRSVLDRKP